MKKLLLAILVTGAGLGLYSCNNGAYDLDPKDNTGALNPLNPENGVTIPVGNMKVTVNGVIYTFYPSVFLDTAYDKTKVYLGYGKLDNDPLFQRWVGLSIQHTEGKDPDMSDKTVVNAWYSYIDSTIDQRVYFLSNWTEAKIDEAGKLKGKEGQAIRGTLPTGEYTVIPTYKKPGSDSQVQPVTPPISTRSIKISGEFHLKKVFSGKEMKFLPAYQ